MRSLSPREILGYTLGVIVALGLYVLIASLWDLLSGAPR